VRRNEKSFRPKPQKSCGRVVPGFKTRGNRRESATMEENAKSHRLRQGGVLDWRGITTRRKWNSNGPGGRERNTISFTTKATKPDPNFGTPGRKKETLEEKESMPLRGKRGGGKYSTSAKGGHVGAHAKKRRDAGRRAIKTDWPPQQEKKKKPKAQKRGRGKPHRKKGGENRFCRQIREKVRLGIGQIHRRNLWK